MESAAPEPPSALVGVDEAAAILGVNKRTVERAIRAAPPERCPHRHPGRGRGERARYYWEGEDAVLDWWRARGTSPPPASVVPTRPRRRTQGAASLAVDDQPVDWGKVRRSL